MIRGRSRDLRQRFPGRDVLRSDLDSRLSPTGTICHVIVIVPANAGSSETKSIAWTTRAFGTRSTNRASTMSEVSVAFPCPSVASRYVRISRYEPPGRASKCSNRPVIPDGGSQLVSASASISAAKIFSGVAAIRRLAVSVRFTIDPRGASVAVQRAAGSPSAPPRRAGQTVSRLARNTCKVGASRECADPAPHPRFSADNKKSRFAGESEPSSGLEPETPSLPWRCSTN